VWRFRGIGNGDCVCKEASNIFDVTVSWQGRAREIIFLGLNGRIGILNGFSMKKKKKKKKEEEERIIKIVEAH
jgi:hypothetical protein